MGGSFDPIHIGHLVMAQAARDKFNLDQVVFIPANLPPHKPRQRLASAKHRLAMVRLAIKGHQAFTCSDFEVNRPGKSYSIDTCRYFRQRYPSETKIFFIVGQDAFAGLKKWKNIDGIRKIVDFIVVNRPGFRTTKGGLPHFSVQMPGIAISSSDVRQQIELGNAVHFLMPPKVAEYIDQNKLYRK